MEMSATGKSNGEWVFNGGFHETVEYMSNHQRLLSFNPFCHKVEQVGDENIYSWHFRVKDPQQNPFEVIFFVEETQEQLLSLPEELQDLDPEQLPEELLEKHTVGQRIKWTNYDTGLSAADPERYRFQGQALGSMLIRPLPSGRTHVDFSLTIDVHFTLYPAFRIIPEKIIRNMTNAGMSFIMQNATNRMFNKMSGDFEALLPG